MTLPQAVEATWIGKARHEGVALDRRVRVRTVDPSLQFFPSQMVWWKYIGAFGVE